MKLIVITTENFFDGETDAINLLYENGLQTLHLRKPHATEAELKTFLEKIKSCFHSRIVLSDCYVLAQHFDVKGIHLNNRNINHKTDISDILKEKEKCPFTVSRSCHSFQEIKESQFCDYVFLSPIFDSISKVGYKMAFTQQQLEDAKSKNIINQKVIALGVITTDNISTVLTLGFGGVAVLGTLWNNFLITKNLNELLIQLQIINYKLITNH